MEEDSDDRQLAMLEFAERVATLVSFGCRFGDICPAEHGCPPAFATVRMGDETLRYVTHSDLEELHSRLARSGFFDRENTPD